MIHCIEPMYTDTLSGQMVISRAHFLNLGETSAFVSYLNLTKCQRT